MVLHNKYIRVGQNGQNRLFGIDPWGGAADNKAQVIQMLISQKGKISHSRIAVILLGIFTLAMGIILSSIPWVDYFIVKNLKLWNGSISFHYWQRPGVVRLTKIYIFNITNPESFLNLGEKPKLTEVGPFVYREDMQKINIKFHENGTLTFQHKKILEFVPELSVNRNERLTVPNIPLLALSTQSNNLGYVIQKAISFVLNMSKHKPFISVTADELVLGYDDGIVDLAHKFYPKYKRPKNKMGLLIGRNGTLTEIETIFTGDTGMDKFGLINNVNGLDKLPFWADEPCSNIQGSEGSFFPPRYFTKKDIVHLYDKDVCRILPLRYRGTETKDGVAVDLYTPSEELYQTVEKEPNNKCFCPGNEFCPPHGLQSIGPCHHDAPLYVSHPHFYGADPKLLEKFDGLSPDKEKHGTYFKIQPKVGVPLEGKVRAQVNIKVEKAPNIPIVSKFPSIIYPIMWLEEGIDELTPPIKRWIYLATTFCDIASPLLTYGFIFIGSCILIGIFVNGYKSLVFTKETIEIGMKTLRRGGTFIHTNNMNNRLLILRDSYSLLPTVRENATEVLV